MSGPIVRTGATPEFSEGWDRIFGKKQGKKPAKAAAKSGPSGRGAKAAKTTKKK